jgi:hypothetical protein
MASSTGDPRRFEKATFRTAFRRFKHLQYQEELHIFLHSRKIRLQAERPS